MGRFIFTLAAVLELRRAEEQGCQLALAEIERQRLDLEAQVRAAQAQLRSQKDDLKALLSGRAPWEPTIGAGAVDLRTVRLQAAASLRSQGGAQRLAIQLAGVYQRADRARGELARAMRRRRAVELLRERQHEAWRREQDRRETAELDEIATMRAGRREAEALLASSRHDPSPEGGPC